MKKLLWFSLNLICFLVIMTSTCYAYIDPATTSYVIQIVAGIIIAGGTTAGILWNKFRRKIKEKKMDNIEELEMESNTTTLKNKNIVTAEDLLDDEDDK